MASAKGLKNHFDNHSMTLSILQCTDGTCIDDVAAKSNIRTGIDYDEVQRVFTQLQVACNGTAVEKGWWKPKPGQPVRDPFEIFALIVTECAEGMEASRSPVPIMSTKIPGFTAIEEEAADVLIRTFDPAQHWGWRLAEAMIAKMQYNRTRPVRHGGKTH